MLSYLRIRGLALLEDVTLEFGRGLNVLTGETGAGKSIIVDGLALLRGTRARADLVREGDESALIEAQFELDDGPVPALLSARGASADDPDGLVLRRMVPRGGKGRAWIQSTLATRGELAEVGELLVDICSQHEHHSLTRVAHHLELLDAYARLEPALDEYRAVFGELGRAREAVAELERVAGDRNRRADYLRFQVEELERVAPEVGEYERLRQRKELLRRARDLAELAREARDTLYESDEAITARLAGLIERFRRLDVRSELLTGLQEQLMAARIACEEAAGAASRFGRELEFEDGELAETDERLHQLESLRRKHGVETDELAARLAEMRDELAGLEHVDERIRAALDHRDALETACVALAAALHERRLDASRRLATAVEHELGSLHMKHARFSATIAPAGALGPSGTDQVEFLFSGNRGESPAPLQRVASGGELSRVLLAIKGVIATGDRVSTYVFDEIDAGVGGAVAVAIGQRLRAASAAHQILCITHLPQIAAFADTHFRVDKSERGGRTVTAVTRLSDGERVEELARMLGGARVTRSARDHAIELLQQARDARRPARPRRSGATG